MIHYLSELSLSEKLRENVQGSAEDIPFVAIESNLAEYVNSCASWHWHEYVELACVVRGCVECCTQNRVLTLKPGDGYFVNANVLHLNRMPPGHSSAVLRIIQFDAQSITGSGGIVQRYVRPVERCTAFDALSLSREDARHRDILDDLAIGFEAAAAEDVGYEMTVLRRLLHAWQLLYEIARPLLERAPAVTDSASSRIKAMLAFIHTNYAEAVSVADMAEAASISEREAFRTFRQVLDTTPTLYLARHRVSVAARMLRETSLPITDIATACGFSNPSYFCKVFRDLAGLPPREFRKQK